MSSRDALYSIINFNADNGQYLYKYDGDKLNTKDYIQGLKMAAETELEVFQDAIHSEYTQKQIESFIQHIPDYQRYNELDMKLKQVKSHITKAENYKNMLKQSCEALQNHSDLLTSVSRTKEILSLFKQKREYQAACNIFDITEVRRIENSMKKLMQLVAKDVVEQFKFDNFLSDVELLQNAVNVLLRASTPNINLILLHNIFVYVVNKEDLVREIQRVFEERVHGHPTEELLSKENYIFADLFTALKSFGSIFGVDMCSYPVYRQMLQTHEKCINSIPDKFNYIELIGKCGYFDKSPLENSTISMREDGTVYSTVWEIVEKGEKTPHLKETILRETTKFVIRALAKKYTDVISIIDGQSRYATYTTEIDEDDISKAILFLEKKSINFKNEELEKLLRYLRNNNIFTHLL